MTNIIIPISGLAQRFIDEGYVVPKPLIMAGHKHIIDWAMEGIDPNQYNLVFIVRKDHCQNFNIDQVIRQKFGKNCKIVIIDKVTQGMLCSCLLAEEFLTDGPVWCYSPDIYIPRINLSVPEGFNGFLLTFKANSKDHSYIEYKDGLVTKTAEKSVLSDQANTGWYWFDSKNTFLDQAKRVKGPNYNNEFYIAPIYNSMIYDGLKVGFREVSKMYVLGTPKDLNFFTNKVLTTFGQKPIALCCDHSGFKTKENLKRILIQKRLQFIDFGTYTENDCDQHIYLNQAIKSIQDGTCSHGIGCCRSGQAFNIYANKNEGVRSAYVFDSYTAQYAVRHNAANFFSIPEIYTNFDALVDIIITLTEHTFDGGRHTTRIQAFEKE